MPSPSIESDPFKHASARSSVNDHAISHQASRKNLGVETLIDARSPKGSEEPDIGHWQTTQSSGSRHRPVTRSCCAQRDRCMLAPGHLNWRSASNSSNTHQAISGWASQQGQYRTVRRLWAPADYLITRFTASTT